VLGPQPPSVLEPNKVIGGKVTYLQLIGPPHAALPNFV
jgi:hypothetical protein